LSGGDGELRPRRSRWRLVLLVAAGVVGVDQTTKAIALDTLRAGPYHVVGPISLRLAYNTGVAFSIGAGWALPIVLVVLVVLAGLLRAFRRSVDEAGVAVALGLVLGGALGNLADRLFRGHGGAVVDFVRVGFWPTFNLADASIVCGAVLLAFSIWRRPSGRRAGGSGPA
jgi:signal peptidase II